VDEEHQHRIGKRGACPTAPQAFAGYSIVNDCPELNTLQQRHKMIGKTILHAFDDSTGERDGRVATLFLDPEASGPLLVGARQLWAKVGARRQLPCPSREGQFFGQFAGVWAFATPFCALQ